MTQQRQTPKVSVVVLTRERPAAFRTLLLSLAQQRMRDFETVVIGAAPAVEDHGAPPSLARRITYAQCEDRNISLSRNYGVALARGEFIAFIDDDAAPEPDWLQWLLKPFAEPKVGGVGGFVRGRNGVDFQWRGALVDRFGEHRALLTEDLSLPGLDQAAGEYFVSTVGVNGAFRREALREIGGFDENFHYFLDESDVCLRLREAGWKIALAPEAEVHHAYAASEERRGNRAPQDLYEIAASRVYFGRVHGAPVGFDASLERFKADQAERLKKFIQLGRLSRREADGLIRRMEAGCAEGGRRFLARGARRLPPPPPHRAAEATYVEADPPRRPRVALVVGKEGAREVKDVARRLAARGCEVTLVEFTLGAGRLKVSFEEGVWVHSGGALGRESFETGRAASRRSARSVRELTRAAPRRAWDAVIRPASPDWAFGDLRPAPLARGPAGYVIEPTRVGSEAAVLSALGR